MNSQNTPVHIRLWHHDFWRLSVANLLLTMAVYMLVPTMPLWLINLGFSWMETGIAMGAFGIGLFVLGGFVSFLVQHYRRNMVCIWSAACMAALLGLSYYFETRISQLPFYVVVLQRLLFGVVFGLAQMVLTSTLIIDTSESYQRTEANHSASWFGRLALSLGPIAGILTEQLAGFGIVLLSAACLSFIAVVLIFLVHFPFRAPQDDVPTFSLDRFFLPHGFPLFFNLQLIMLAAGLLFSMSLTIHFYTMMMAGFLSALLAQRFIFRDAEVKSEVVTGLILMGAALLMMLTRTQQIVVYAAPLFIGFALGIIGARFLLFFIKLSRHCQRGTSQSTFMLGWESGIAWGIGIGYALLHAEEKYILPVALTFVVLALVMYNFTHDWFVRNKNR